MAQPRITDAQRRLVEDLHGKGLGRNVIARRVGIAAASVTKICTDLGLTFDREHTRQAVAARKADAAALRSELELTLLEDAQKLRGQLWQKHTYIDHGGKEFTRVEWTQDEPSPGDKHRLMQAAANAIDRSIRLSELDKDDEVEEAKAMLVDLFEALGVAFRGPQADA
jgi:hypothetical protein